MRGNQMPASDQGNPLGCAPIGGLIAKYAIPAIISMLVNAAYNITDQIFIGHEVGLLGNGATNVAFPVVILTAAFSQLIGVGTAANFNIRLGAGQRDEAKDILGAGLSLMSFVGVAIACVVVLWKTPILLLCGATESVLPYAQEYLGITAFGIPFLLFSSAGSLLVRADGSPTYSMACTVAGAALNVVLDWLFMVVFQWGIRGAALATITGQCLSFLLCLRYFTRFRTFPIRREMLRLRRGPVIAIVKLGTSNFINQSIIMVVNILMNNTLRVYGGLSVYGSDIPLAVSGVIAKLNTILMAFAVGLAQGSQPILGFNMGAGNYDRVKATFKRAAVIALGISVAAFLLFQLFPRQIVSIFGDGSDLYFQFAERYMRVFMLMVCVLGIQPLCVNYFTATGNVRQGIFLSLSRQGFFFIPLILILPAALGIDGVLYAGPIADSAAFVLSLTLVNRNLRQLTALSRQP